jgi:hypothetical protein
MDGRMQCPRCGEHQAVLAAFVGPTAVTEASRCTGCGTVTTGTGMTELLQVLRRDRRAKRKTGR